ncbi:hypothetical protein TVAG_224110 [Trichomonas vaginalis G3]|uniref:Uncharacterized protein n=1 Tax=Trichomonas vaginalis (strain ATCC PRA-98 / G3) TaxID=412133 RepID=A2DW34_TRIV3|nr:armadillo (ARM) repeat-containing protein family [Trichomonas vaginalis G3]EAY15335.1 hypothetical protein TVAG_224110 [Trichomonas vaginalis G3]KAI5496802.1 armadillo (ARM) repeat-containing protein family [Trichomonas vaginalis G3]|eukprot:XP_001327558.1 hypothetical protein [Trichomonas vaginalis G3]
MDDGINNNVGVEKIPSPINYSSKDEYYQALKIWFRRTKQNIHFENIVTTMSAFYCRPKIDTSYKIEPKVPIKSPQILQLLNIIIEDSPIEQNQQFNNMTRPRDPFISEFLPTNSWNSYQLDEFPDPNNFGTYESYKESMIKWIYYFSNKIPSEKIPYEPKYFADSIGLQNFKKERFVHKELQKIEPLKAQYDRFPKTPVKFKDVLVLRDLKRGYMNQYNQIELPFASAFILDSEMYGIDDYSAFYTPPPISKSLRMSESIQKVRSIPRKYPYLSLQDYHDLLIAFFIFYFSDNASGMSFIFNSPYSNYALIKATNMFSYNVPYVNYFPPMSEKSVKDSSNALIISFTNALYNMHYVICAKEVLRQAKLSADSYIIKDVVDFANDCMSYFEKEHSSKLVEWLLQDFDLKYDCATSIVIIILLQRKFFPTLFEIFAHYIIHFINVISGYPHCADRFVSAIINSVEVKFSLVIAIIKCDIPSGLTFAYNPQALSMIEVAINSCTDKKELEKMDCEWFTTRFIQCVVNVDSEYGIQFAYISLALSKLMKRMIESKMTKQRKNVLKDIISYLSTMCGEEIRNSSIRAMMLKSLSNLAMTKEFQDFVFSQRGSPIVERYISASLNNDEVAYGATMILKRGLRGLMKDDRFHAKLRNFFSPFMKLLSCTGPETTSLMLRILALVINEKSPKFKQEQRAQVDVFMVLSTLPPDLALLFQIFDEGGFCTRKAAAIVVKGACSSKARKNRHIFEESLKAHPSCHPLVAKIGTKQTSAIKRTVSSGFKK